MDVPALLRARFGGLPRAFWWIWVGLLLNRAGVFVQPLLTFYLTLERGLGLTEAALVVSAYGAGSVVGSLLGGVAADRLGRRVTMIVSAFAGAAGLVVLGEARGFWGITAAAFGTALVWDLHRPAVHAMVADIVPPEHRIRAFGLQYVAVNLGFAVAPVLAGWLAGVGYATLFAAAAVVQLGWAAFVLAFLPETRSVAAAAAARVPGGAGLGTALRDGVYVRFLLLCVLLTLLPHQSFVALSAWMASQGHSPATFGSVIALNGVLIVLVQPWIVEAVGRRDVPRVFMVASVLYGVGFMLHGVSPLVAVHALAIATWTMGEILVAPVQSGVAATLAPPEARGRYQGLMGTSFSTAGMIAPLVGAAVMDRFGGRVLWFGCLGLGLVCAAGMAWMGPRLRERLRGGLG